MSVREDTVRRPDGSTGIYAVGVYPGGQSENPASPWYQNLIGAWWNGEYLAIPVPGQPAGFQKRHESVVGPQISSYANGQAPGAWKDFTSGVGRGATAAPPWSFRHGI